MRQIHTESPVAPFAGAIPSNAAFARAFQTPPIEKNDRRRWTRVPLVMAARVRRLGPFGLETESTQTHDGSRGGLLISSREPHSEGSLVWITFPYDPHAALAEPETPARVVRCSDAQDGSYRIAVSFEPRAAQGSRDGANRRRNPRVALAMFVRVTRTGSARRSGQIEHEPPPWPEETMTANVSPSGMLFYSLRDHEVGERLSIASPSGQRIASGERRALVVRLARMKEDSPLMCVAAEFLC